MLSMGSGNGTTYGASFEGRVFELSNVGIVLFSVTGLTSGTITIQYSKNYDRRNPSAALWYSLDATNLVFTADGAKYALWGGSFIRAIGATIVETALSVSIEGDNVFDPATSQPVIT